MGVRVMLGVSLAGAFGAWVRYTVDGAISQRAGGAFPWGTFLINVSGSLLLGFLFTIFTERLAVAPWLRSSITVGFIGAYTTFSTWTLESVRLLEDRAYALAFANLAGSLVVGVAAVYAGIILARTI